MADVDELIAAAHAARHPRAARLRARTTRATEHPWFVDARSSRPHAHRDWYVWADPKPDGSPPNNWVSSFGGPAWTLDEPTGQYYLHNHLREQPDLNWWNEEVRDEFDDILRFWFDRGVAGFRIDVCNMIVKDAELRDNPPATDDDPLDVAAVRPAPRLQREPARGARRPPPVARDRRLATTRPGCCSARRRSRTSPTLGRVLRHRRRRAAARVQLPVHQRAVRRRSRCATIVERTEAALPPGAWPAWTGSNHDMSRFATRWAGDDPRADPGRAAHAARRCAARRCSTRATRSASATRRSSRRTCATRSASGTGPPTPGATRCARRCTGATRRAAGSPTPAAAVAAAR